MALHPSLGQILLFYVLVESEFFPFCRFILVSKYTLTYRLIWLLCFMAQRIAFLRVPWGNRASKDVYMYTRERFLFKEVIHVTVASCKCEIHRVGWKAGDPGKGWCCCLESEDSVEAKFILPQGTWVLSVKAFSWREQALLPFWRVP